MAHITGKFLSSCHGKKKRMTGTMTYLGKRAGGLVIIGTLLLTTGMTNLASAKDNAGFRGPVHENFHTSIEEMQEENRVHDVGNIWMNFTNYGYFGNNGPTGTFLRDPCTNEWAPQAEFPGGSGAQYLFQGALWIGAVIKEDGFEYPRVSHGVEGWSGGERAQEFHPGFTPGNGIEERSTRSQATNCLGDFVSHPDAISEQDFVATYTDTSRVNALGNALRTNEDGPHIPLGIKVTQKSYSWSYNYAQDFILIDYEIENIADNFLKNLYIGLYVDGDVGMVGTNNAHTDDITGFTKAFEYTPDGAEEPISLTINTAWIADNDGRAPTVSNGSDFTVADVTGTRVVRAPNPRLRTSFNWWISNGDVDLDFGPSWVEDHSDAQWTQDLGTPESDSRKYFVLSNREFDYNQIQVDDADYIRDNPQQFIDRFTGDVVEEQAWKVPGDDDPTPGENLSDLADGYDTRYLISWGPLGIFDFIDESGDRIYRLNPGEKFSMTIAYVAGSNFHNRNTPQPSDTDIDETLFDFGDFQNNADWASKVYDNPMIDTNGDTWFGEDTGTDGVYADTIGKVVEFVNIHGQFESRVYDGPDVDFTELDGILQEEEDRNEFRPIEVDYTYNNGLFDFGDGFPDFQGPPPPPTPILTYRVTEDNLYLRWTPFPSEDPAYLDPFSRMQDFEGYRIYASNSGLESEFSFLDEFDRVDFAYYSDRDSLMAKPVTNTTGMPEMKPDVTGTVGYLRPVGQNIGFDAILKSDNSTDPPTLYYEYDLGKVQKLMPRYYSVAAFDFGDPGSGTEPLETAKTANMIFMAPSGNKDKKPMVVPNPYRADEDYRVKHLQTVYEVDTTFTSWENRNDGTEEFFPQTDRRIYFVNIPEMCLIRVYTVSGDLVQIIDHNVEGNRISTWNADFAEVWDMNSRNRQQIVSGIYLFSVEDYTEENKGHIDVGKFVIIR